MNKTRLAVLLSCSLITLAAQSAKYRVVELPTDEIGQTVSPSDINNVGSISVNVQKLYNPIIDVSLINFELETLKNNLTDIESAKKGDFNDADYSLLYTYITQNRANQGFQQLAESKSFLADENDATLIPAFDTFDSINNNYIGSTTTIVRGLNDFNYSVGWGQGGFYKLPYTKEDGTELTYVVNDFSQRAFAQVNGNTIALPPPDITVGGLSEAFDINNNNQIVGSGTTAISSTAFQTSVDNCLDDTERGDMPVESCLRTLNLSLASAESSSSIAQRRGLIWQLDDQGNLLSTKQLGMLLTPAEDDTRIYNSSAVAINDNGIAVGNSPMFYQDSTNRIVGAAIFNGGQVSTINQNREIVGSYATDINNQDLVVGYVQKRINGTLHTKFFVHEIDNDKTIFPSDFFVGSSSVATSINNNGLVVGFGDTEPSLDNRRRSGGFLYDSVNDTFSDINSLTGCDSPYDIQVANAINDNNEIVATAVKKGKSTNIKGEVQLGADGTEIETDVVVAVKLIPIEGGAVEQCDVVDDINRPRQGASSSWLLLLTLFGFAFRNRKRD